MKEGFRSKNKKERKINSWSNKSMKGWERFNRRNKDSLAGNSKK